MIMQGDSLMVLRTLKSESVDCVITSPPYWQLRSYGVDGELGQEPKFEQFVDSLVTIFDEVKRVLKKEGTCFVNIGDTYSGNKEGKTDRKVSNYLKDTTTRIHKKAVITEKCLCQIPSRFSLAMTDRGWILRNKIIWHKPNCMPSSVRDRFTVDFEEVFFFVKNKQYYFEQQFDPYAPASDVRYRQALRAGKSYNSKEPYTKNTPYSNPKGRNRRCVWSINTKPFMGPHFATFPEALVERMILAGCPKGGVVLDPFSGAATTGVVAKKYGREYIGIELNPEYVALSEKRLSNTHQPLFSL